MTQATSLADGADLTPESWSDFVYRLRYDTEGEGVRRHYTADAVFIVEMRVERVVPEGYGGRVVIFDGCESSESPEDFFSGCCDETKAKLNLACDGNFLAADSFDQERAIEEHLPDYSLIYLVDDWEFVCQHLTRDAADAFIERKKHDYRLGLRVNVDASTYSWELNTIKAAILSGRIGLLPEQAAQGEKQCS